MEPNEILLSRGGGGGANNGKTGEGFIDRSKVRILLCDNDMKSSEEVFDLLCKCSYQVTSVRSPRQVIDALNADGPDIDIILSEVDLPMAKGFKMLKYIMRDTDLRRIPVIMMSAQDEVSLVVKCLRLGAADYLVKPLRTNELLNLWTHMWRRRRMLGLAEKNIMNCEFDLVHSDPSDANTNSTMFSDDTDERSKKNSNPEMSLSVHHEDESNMIVAPGPTSAQFVDLSDDQPNVPEINEQQRAKIMSGPKKSVLKIGQSSAFFTYVKSNTFTSTTPASVGVVSTDETTPPRTEENTPRYQYINEKFGSWVEHGPSSLDTSSTPPFVKSNTFTSTTPAGTVSIDESTPAGTVSIDESTPPCTEANTVTISPTLENDENAPRYPYINEKFSSWAEHGPGSLDMSSTPPFPTEPPDIRCNPYSSPYPYYLSGAMNHVMMSSNQYPHFPHHMAGMPPPFPYYPVGLMPPWPPNGGSSKLDRREAALIKFRQKRKERCFDKKIRYVNRKKLAERRPRVRGQFVRKINGINVDLNGQPTSNFDEEEEDDEEEEEETAGRDSSPENDYN